MNDLITIVSDNWLLLLVGQYPNGPLGGWRAPSLCRCWASASHFP